MIGLPIQENTPEWDAIRLENVGGSEVAALFGVQPDFAMSAMTLHLVKARRIEPPEVDDSPGSRIWYGRKMKCNTKLGK